MISLRVITSAVLETAGLPGRKPRGITWGALGTAEESPPIRQLHPAGASHVATVLRGVALHDDPVAGLQIRLFPSLAFQGAGAAHFELPASCLAFRIRSVDEEQRVRVDPFEFGHRAGDSDQLIFVVLGGERVVCGSANRREEQHGRCGSQ